MAEVKEKVFKDNESLNVNPWSITQNPNIDPDKYLFDKKGENDIGVVAANFKESGLDTFEMDRKLADIGAIMAQVLAGNPEALNEQEFTCLNFKAMQAALSWLLSTNQMSNLAKLDLSQNAWRLNFKCKPPTPAEFMTEKYIGPMAESLRDPIRDIFIESFDPLAPYRTLVLTPHIGWGKSTLSVLANLYVSTHFAMMWHPYKYFGLSVSTMFTQVLGAWNMKKASELLLEPFMNILENSPYFIKVRTHGDILDKNQSDEVEDHLYWTTSTPTSALQMQNGVNYKIINGPGAILGQTIITGVISELTTFVDEGWSEEKILKFFTKLRKRIDSRMNGNYYGRFILDSQPNTLESCIDKWIWEEAPNSKENYIVTGSRWKYFPQEFPYAFEKPRTKWTDPIVIKHDFIDGFPIFKGGNGQTPVVVETPAQLSTYDPHDIEWCPVRQITANGVKDFRDSARENPIEFLRDWCGIPSGAADRIFYNPKTVENVFDNKLKNVFGGLDAPAEVEPEHLIWDKVKDTFFNKVVDKYYYYYEPDIPRVASVDLAISGDVASVAVSHVERSKDIYDSAGNPAKIYVTDFVIPVIPKNSIINLDAFKFFLIDLRQLGNLNIKHVSFDGFQSRSIMQGLQRFGFDVDLLSVDKQNEPYQALIDYAFHNRWKCGKSVMLKNNLLSLEIATRKVTGTKKIDHKKGENCYADDFCPINGVYTENGWENSQVGYYAKDLSDCVAANIALLDTYDNEYLAIKEWEPYSMKERNLETMTQGVNNLMMKMNLS